MSQEIARLGFYLKISPTRQSFAAPLRTDSFYRVYKAYWKQDFLGGGVRVTSAEVGVLAEKADSAAADVRGSGTKKLIPHPADSHASSDNMNLQHMYQLRTEYEWLGWI